MKRNVVRRVFTMAVLALGPVGYAGGAAHAQCTCIQGPCLTCVTHGGIVRDSVGIPDTKVAIPSGETMTVGATTEASSGIEVPLAPEECTPPCPSTRSIGVSAKGPFGGRPGATLGSARITHVPRVRDPMTFALTADFGALHPRDVFIEVLAGDHVVGSGIVPAGKTAATLASWPTAVRAEVGARSVTYAFELGEYREVRVPVAGRHALRSGLKGNEVRISARRVAGLKGRATGIRLTFTGMARVLLKPMTTQPVTAKAKR